MKRNFWFCRLSRAQLVTMLFLLPFATDSFGQTKTYDVWRNTVNNTATAQQAAINISGTTYDDTTAQAGQTYYYWVKVRTSVLVGSYLCRRFGDPNGYITNAFDCPTSAVRNNVAEIRSIISFSPNAGPYPGAIPWAGTMTMSLWEQDILFDNEYTEASETERIYQVNPNANVIKSYINYVDIGAQETLDPTAEVYQRVQYVPDESSRGTSDFNTPVVDVALQDAFDPAPSGVSASTDRGDRIRVSWNSASGNSSFSAVASGSRPVCSYTLATASANHTYSAGSGNFNVLAPNGCAWTATTSYGWIHTSSASSGNGTVNYTVDANPSTSARSGTISVQSQTFTVNQAGKPCSYTLAPTSVSLGWTAQAGSFSVTCPGGCAWVANTSDSWIHTSSSGNGNGSVGYTIEANFSLSARSGTIVVQGQTFAVAQAGQPCTYTLVPSSVSLGCAAQVGSFDVVCPVGCDWEASTSDSWIHATGSGGGSATVSYTIDANDGVIARSGTITVGGQTFGVNQGGQFGYVITKRVEINNSSDIQWRGLSV